MKTTMENQFKITTVTRANILACIEDLSLEQINFVPNNFNNTIGWQVAHLVVTQQLLHYKLSGNPMLVDDDLVENFRKGSSGKYLLTYEQWHEVLKLLKSLPIRLKADYNCGKLSNYSSYETSYNLTLETIENAIEFSNIHDSMHYGAIMAMKKCLPQFS